MQGSYTLKLPGLMEVSRSTDAEGLDRVYKLLNLRSLRNPTGQNVRHALQWSPVIVIGPSIVEEMDHVVVVSGHHGGQYLIVDPCDDFNKDICTAGEYSMPELDIDGQLREFIWYW